MVVCQYYLVKDTQLSVSSSLPPWNKINKRKNITDNTCQLMQVLLKM